eukprot:1552884-Prymnesium_polylepis.1
MELAAVELAARAGGGLSTSQDRVNQATDPSCVREGVDSAPAARFCADAETADARPLITSPS